MRLALALVAVSLLAAPAAQEPGLDPLEALVYRSIYLRPPPNHCNAPGLALALAREAGIPAGAEYLPGDCNYRLPGQEDQGSWIPLIGMTYREAFDRLAVFDPRYSSVISDGVFVIRPIEAWGDEEHFLNQPIGEFIVGEEDAFVALDRLARQVAPWPQRGSSLVRDMARRTDQSTWPLAVELTAASGTLALDAIVRTHGKLAWSVRYCKTEARPEYATITVRTYDGSSWGKRVWPPVPPGGKFVDPCRQ